MSASREKNKRKDQVVGGETSGPAKKGMSKGLKWTLGVICLILVVAIVAFFSMLTSGFFVTHTTAAVADGHNLSPAMVNYFYKDSYNNFYSTYSSYISYILDTETPLDEQFYDEETGKTWADYFIEQGLTTAASTYAIYDEAMANGFTLTDEEQAAITSNMEMFNTYATAYGYSNASAFIAAQYGTGCNAKSYEEYLTVSTIASSYAAQINEGFSYTADDLSAEYAANANNYDGVNYRLFSVTSSMFQAPAEDDAETAELTDEEQAALDAQVAAAAQEMAETTKGDEQAFIDYAYNTVAEDSKESYQDGSVLLRSDYSYANCATELADWLFDSARQNGDTTYVEYSGGYYVAYYLSREAHDYAMPNVRHILISVEDTTDTEAMAEAKTKAEDLLAEYQSGEQTEDAFAALADENSDDSPAGGLYENVVPGQMVASFNSWCYDESRQPGDVGIIESDYGYHVMYFIGDGDNYRDYLVETSLRSNDYTAWQDSVTGDATYTQNAFPMRFITK